MNYNEIGKTGMKVSQLSFGASSLGGVFHSVKEADALEAVFTAVELGMNFIDVSPYYGHYKAEIVLGKALKEIPRGKYYLSTKVGRYGKDGVNTWDYSAKRAKRMESTLGTIQLSVPRRAYMSRWSVSISIISTSSMCTTSSSRLVFRVDCRRFATRRCLHFANCATKASLAM